MSTSRTLIYTCCDKKYSHFIPLFCAALLYSNTNIDIEIGVSCNSLDPKETAAINELQKLYPNSKILIKYNFFSINSNISDGPYRKAIYNGNKMMINTVRFVSNPTIKDEYTYISDIDIISLKKNFSDYHIKVMSENNMIYNNIVRETLPTHMSGLHFVKSDKWYPLNLNNITNIQYHEVDEAILKKITMSKTALNTNLKVRPVHGPHLSLNRKNPGGTYDKNGKLTIPGWGAKQYKAAWYEFIKSKEYKIVEKSFDPMITELLTKLMNYYAELK